MKINEIIKESHTDLVARYHRNPNDDIDDYLNIEAREYNKESKEYYKQYFSGGSTPVFRKSTNYENPNETKWSHKPEPDHRQSAGYRGQQYALAKAGLPHSKKVQKPDSRYRGDDLNIDNLPTI